MSGWRPTVNATGDVGRQWQTSRPGIGEIKTKPRGVGLTLSQNLFNGLKTVSSTKQAKANVRAGRQNLLAVEQEVLLDAATAYMDVLKDRQVTNLRRKNVSFLQQQLNASNTRFEVGEITRTDVAQSRARLSLARSQLAQARAQLGASNARYIQLISRKPGKLAYPRVSPRVPKSLRQALAQAQRINPQILAAAFNEEAARHNISVVRGDLLPKISLDASYSYRQNPASTLNSTETGTIVGTLSVPLYQAGRVHSQMREAKQLASQRRLQVLVAHRAVRQSVTSAWYLYIAAGQTIASSHAQVKANLLALEGVRQEALVGSRTTLDVLDARTDLVESQVLLAGARRDQIVAAYQLISAVGRMTAANLRLSVAIYDPTEYYLDVEHKFLGTSIPE